MAVDTTSTLNKDNYLDEASPTVNQSTDTRLVAGSFGAGGNAYRPIINFTTPNISGTISKIDLYMYQTNNYSGSATLEVHEVTQTAWTEAGSTWNKYDGTNNWATAGGDFSATVVNTFGPPGVGSWVNVNLYGGGATNPISAAFNTNYHFLFKLANEATNNVLAYASKEEGSHIPYLEITYTAGGSAFTPKVTIF